MNMLISIMPFLQEADEELLLVINCLHTQLLDQIMWILSDKLVWIPFYILLAILMYRRIGARRTLIALLCIALTITAADQLCASLIRPMVARLRPTNPENPISGLVHVVNGYRGGSYGFPSCHAANTFALAMFLSLVFRRRMATAGMFMWAAIVSYSRIYLGVHYPSDVLAGLIVGCSLAAIFFTLHLAIAQWTGTGRGKPIAQPPSLMLSPSESKAS